MLRPILISLAILLLMGCAAKSAPTTPTHKAPSMSPMSMSYLEQGKRDFAQGYYKRALHALLPLACDGNAEAQYAVGYMYYYGYGVTQDSFVGHFWIERAAKQGLKPAEDALALITKDPHR